MSITYIYEIFYITIEFTLMPNLILFLELREICLTMEQFAVILFLNKKQS